MIRPPSRFASAVSELFVDNGELRNSTANLHRAATVGIAIAFLWASGASAQVDPVATRLKERNINFTHDGSGNTVIAFKTSTKGRAQQVLISGTTKPILGQNIRTIFSPVAKFGKDGPGGAAALKLLENNSAMPLGFWAISGEYLCFIVKIDDDINAEALHFLIVSVAELADKKQLEITGETDEF